MFASLTRYFYTGKIVCSLVQSPFEREGRNPPTLLVRLLGILDPRARMSLLAEGNEWLWWFTDDLEDNTHTGWIADLCHLSTVGKPLESSIWRILSRNAHEVWTK